MIRRPPRSTRKESSAASDVYKRQLKGEVRIVLTPSEALIGGCITRGRITTRVDSRVTALLLQRSVCLSVCRSGHAPRLLLLLLRLRITQLHGCGCTAHDSRASVVVTRLLTETLAVKTRHVRPLTEALFAVYTVGTLAVLRLTSPQQSPVNVHGLL